MSDAIPEPSPPAFVPPRWLRSPHVQNITSSVGLRKWLVHHQARTLRQKTEDCILTCDDVRLHGELSRHPDAAAGMVLLFHGWEGSSRSTYVVSAATHLFKLGYNVFRLNFRDHGDSHRLNRGLFNSTLIEEVVTAVGAVQQQFPHPRYYLAGFSLGGNFALRTALRAPERGIQLDRVVAVCPVIDPASAMAALENGRFFYHQYFVSKWKQSLGRKLRHFPEYNYGEALRRIKTLRGMNNHFIPKYTQYQKVEDYFDAYTLTGDRLASLQVDTTIIHSRDDPIILHDDFAKLAASRHLRVETTPYGAHCAFLENSRLGSWADRRLGEIFSA
ncbi:alpha/beta fold hydrolase [Exilibacterium tricleocarpae]|uniref:Alpha/beta fold hydrolase n=1 Tax=Exilibacterium tricleocarpae TaxID=2591008 RepID=A0A545U6Y1_9GAMM|nr:alpha/beta fold hydrolase [Exilibacterium tricleocarpae]TQV85241.1 alpha/beta fold hydrolase [Exilibacterium tricleocarpae]